MTTGPSSHVCGFSSDENKKREPGSGDEPSAQLEQMPEHPSDLQKLVLLPLLQRHQGPGRLVRVLRVGEDAPDSLLRLHVPRFLEQSHQRVLVDVLEDVGSSLLPVRGVKFVAVDTRTDPATLRGRVGHLVSLCLGAGSQGAGRVDGFGRLRWSECVRTRRSRLLL